MSIVVVSTAGTTGPPAPGWLHGTGDPSDTIGIDGSFYIDQTNPNTPTYWGPKTLGTWVGHGPYTFA